MSINKEILREYKEMNLNSFSDGQINIAFPDEDDLRQVQITLLPNAGFYKDGKFEFQLVLPEDYPNSVPTANCNTIMFHPNISYDGSICLNIFSDEFDTCLRLADYAHALLWLLYQPNLDSLLNSDCPQDLDEFAAKVRQSIEGGQVAGQHFDSVLVTPASSVVEEPVVHDTVQVAEADTVQVAEAVATPAIEQAVVIPAIEQAVATPAIEQPVVTPAAEAVATPAIEQAVVTPAIEQPVVTPAIEAVATPAIEQAVATPPLAPVPLRRSSSAIVSLH
jgi:ubiquitin-conjugating enzyme E2 M